MDRRCASFRESDTRELRRTPSTRSSGDSTRAKFEGRTSTRLLDIALYALRILKVMNFREFCQGEVRRISLLGTSVNKPCSRDRALRYSSAALARQGPTDPHSKMGLYEKATPSRRNYSPLFVGSRVSGDAGGCYDVVSLRSAIRPGGEIVVGPPERLRRGGAYGVVRADYNRA